MSISIGGFSYTCGTGRRSGTWQPVNILLLWILFQAMPIKNVWPLHSQSACSQVSAVLFYVRTTKFVGAQTCVGDMCFSSTSEGSATSSQWKNWSGNCRVCHTCSASPVREKWMCKRNVTTVKIVKNQSSNFKSLRKKGVTNHWTEVDWTRLDWTHKNIRKKLINHWKQNWAYILWPAASNIPHQRYLGLWDASPRTTYIL